MGFESMWCRTRAWYIQRTRWWKGYKDYTRQLGAIFVYITAMWPITEGEVSHAANMTSAEVAACWQLWQIIKHLLSSYSRERHVITSLWVTNSVCPIYMSPVVKLLLHTRSNILTKQKAKTFGVCHTRGCDTGGEQPRVVAPENNGS